LAKVLTEPRGGGGEQAPSIRNSVEHAKNENGRGEGESAEGCGEETPGGDRSEENDVTKGPGQVNGIEVPQCQTAEGGRAENHAIEHSNEEKAKRKKACKNEGSPSRARRAQEEKSGKDARER
jgi:hypothetical protein